MSLYSTPIAYSALVAGPLKNGEVVASCRNTSRNSFSAEVRIPIFRAPDSLVSHPRPLVGPLGKSSTSCTGFPALLLKYTSSMFRQRTWRPKEPTPPPCPHAVSPVELQQVLAR